MNIVLTGRAADSPFRKSARVGRSNLVTPAIFKMASTAMSGAFLRLYNLSIASADRTVGINIKRLK
ncbi:hypothetical protein CIK00_19025 [Photobacterium carnosum]|uniref:Uncharacterized protein n=1 Tax=Photobacterium carnosum TaxID=2023717 RepID=A0A2N4UMM8_9GAMM|nr:hypothetical protein CIK00_19025 [Photobacterium carnosum]